MLQEKINTKLIESIKDKPVAIGCSGGSDSMALLHLLKDVLNNFVVINFEHGIRGESSRRDTQFVKDYCKKNNIKCEVVKLDTPQTALSLGLTIEEAARKLRYDYFSKLLSSKRIEYILLAHHKQDQVETVLMRIFRGTGIDGLQGIKEINGGIIRPLINVSKEEILDYIKENNIEYVNDETNDDTKYTRNFIRHTLLPIIKERYPKVEDSISRLASIAGSVDEYFNSLVEVEKISENEVSIPLDINCDEVFRKSIKQAYMLLNITQDIEYRHYKLIDELKELENGKSLKMPYDTTAYKEYDKIVIAKDIKSADFEIPFKLPLDSAKLNDKVAFVKVEGDFDVKDGLYFDYDLIPDGAVIRYRKDGDVFTKFGGGTKNLGDYLTDKKVPLRVRDRILVVAKDSTIYLIVGVAISDKVRINDRSQNIYKITTENNNGI